MKAERKRREPGSQPPGRPKGRSRCFEAVADPTTLQRRLANAVESFGGLKGYERFYRRLVALGRDDPVCARDLVPNLVDRAYGAEADLRVLCHEALATLNELRDSGELERALDRAAETIRDRADAASLLSEAREALEGDGLAIDAAFLDEAVAIAKHWELTAEAGRQGVAAAMRGENGNEERFEVTATRRAGLPGRAGVDTFFRPGGITNGSPLYVPDDCHHRNPILGHDHLEAIDAYSTSVAGLAGVRELFYHHARTVDAVGPPAAEGDDPVTAIVVGAIVIGAILVIAGATIGIGCATGAWSGDICNYWWILLAFGVIFIAGGICVAVGACTFVLHLFIAIAA